MHLGLNGFGPVLSSNVFGKILFIASIVSLPQPAKVIFSISNFSEIGILKLSGKLDPSKEKAINYTYYLQLNNYQIK